MTDSKQIDDGGLAFPGTRAEQVGWASDHGIDTGIDRPTYGDVQHPGMSLRDWFAGQALIAIFARPKGPSEKPAQWAYLIADAMIAARKAGAAELVKGAPEVWCHCLQCGASTDTTSDDNRAALKWNRRIVPVSASLTQELDRLRDENKTLREAAWRLMIAANDVDLGRSIHNSRKPDDVIEGPVWVILREASAEVRAALNPAGAS